MPLLLNQTRNSWPKGPEEFRCFPCRFSFGLLVQGGVVWRPSLWLPHPTALQSIVAICFSAPQYVIPLACSGSEAAVHHGGEAVEGAHYSGVYHQPPQEVAWHQLQEEGAKGCKGSPEVRLQGDGDEGRAA